MHFNMENMIHISKNTALIVRLYAGDYGKLVGAAGNVNRLYITTASENTEYMRFVDEVVVTGEPHACLLIQTETQVSNLTHEPSHMQHDRWNIPVRHFQAVHPKPHDFSFIK